MTAGLYYLGFQKLFVGDCDDCRQSTVEISGEQTSFHKLLEEIRGICGGWFWPPPDPVDPSNSWTRRDKASPEPPKVTDCANCGPAEISVPDDAFNAGALPGSSGLQRPEYPKACRDKGLSGRVVAEFDVSPEGFASNPRVIQSSDRCFESAALRIISKMRFEPAYDESGRAVWRRGVRQTINYELE